MKTIFLFITLCCSATTTFAQYETDSAIKSYSGWKNVHNGLPGGQSIQLQPGDTHFTTGFIFEKIVKKDSRGVIVYPFDPKPEVEVWFIEGGVFTTVVMPILNAPGDLDSWVNMGYPIRLSVRRDIILSNGLAQADYSGRFGH